MSKQVLTSGVIRQFQKSLHNSLNEKDVESAWRSLFNERYRAYPSYIMQSPYKVDGYITYSELGIGDYRILLEFKYGLDFTEVYDRAKVVAQQIYYLKRFRDAGDELPNILVGADNNQAFILYGPNFYHYLDEGYDWGLAPSEAYKEPILMQALMSDQNLTTWTYHFDGNAKDMGIGLEEFFKEVSGLQHESKGSTEAHRVKISASNIQQLFDRFSSNGLYGSGLDAVEQVGVFMQLLKGSHSDDIYLNPNNPNILHIKGKKYNVQGMFLSAFFKHYDRRLKPSELNELVAIADNLIEDTKRRYHGDFWTPKHLVDRSHEYLEEVLGANYREDTLVWDSAAGTSNLTRDYRYSNLYVSTLHGAELELGMGYNAGVCKFQYDFLNDDVDKTPESHPNPDDWVMPTELYNALLEAGKTGKRVLFYTNPPYGTAGNANKDGTSKKGMASTKMNEWMKQNKWGASSQQLYAQFFARIYKLVEDFNLTNVYIGYFTKTMQFVGGGYWDGYVKLFGSKFEHVGGYLVNSGEFGGTSSAWGVTFSIYKLRDEDSELCDRYTVNIEESEFDEDDMRLKLVNKGVKEYRSVDKKDLIGEWVREPIKRMKNEAGTVYPSLTSAFIHKDPESAKTQARLLEGSMGYMVFGGSTVEKGAQQLNILSSVFNNGHGLSILESNFERAMVGFSVRRSVIHNWINDKDNFSAPTLPLDDEFINDCIVYSLFDNSSYQASYRKWQDGSEFSNTYRPGVWGNQFFWVEHSKVLEWVDTPETFDLYHDALDDEDRYVAKLLKGRQLSSEAQALLDEGTELYKQSLPYRKLAQYSIPEVHPMTWDSGYTQIKRILDQYSVDKNYNARFLEFREALRKKIEDGVYRYGFLVK